MAAVSTVTRAMLGAPPGHRRRGHRLLLVGQGYYLDRPMESEEIGRLLGDDLPAPARKPATTG